MKGTKKYKDLFVPGSILLSGLLIAGAVLYAGGFGQDLFSGRLGAVLEKGMPSSDTAEDGGTDAIFTIGEGDHVLGDPSATVTLVEFSDFQCPYCRQFHPVLQQALAEYGSDIRWVYKHFPLDSLHPNARPAAEASECIWEQADDAGFWAFADILFGNQNLLGDALYKEAAQQIGVDLVQFDSCVSSRKYQEKVEQDYQQGIQAGVNGTPGTFVNGVPVRGALPFDENSEGYQLGQPTLKAIIESQL